jgi:hypothetical protein
MEAEPVEWVVAIAVFHIATDRMLHVGSMHTYLVLSSCLQLELHQRMILRAVEYVEVCDSIFATVVGR